jgi:cytochrome c oxidase subunit 4
MSDYVHDSHDSTEHAVAHPSYGTFIKVWVALVILTGLLVLSSHFGQSYAVWGLLTLTPIKAGLVFYFFMHLKYEGALLKGVVLITIGTLLIFFALLFSDVAFH